MASPFWPYATIQSSMALVSGKLPAPLTSSAPSETTQLAPFCTPTSLSNRDRGTPVHSAQLVKPGLSLNGLIFGTRLVAQAFEEMRTRHGRKTLQVIERKL